MLVFHWAGGFEGGVCVLLGCFRFGWFFFVWLVGLVVFFFKLSIELGIRSNAAICI